MLKLLIDENLDQRILRGLQLRVPGLLYTVVQETGLAGVPDAVLLEWAAQNQQVLVTHDRKTMLKAAHVRSQVAQTAPFGLRPSPQQKNRGPRGGVRATLLLECSTGSDFENQVVFIPL